MNENILIERREQARQMCARRNVAILPYGEAFWLKGTGVDLVMVDLAWLKPADLVPYDIHER